jgi:hypothetical protein
MKKDKTEIKGDRLNPSGNKRSIKGRYIVAGKTAARVDLNILSSSCGGGFCDR